MSLQGSHIKKNWQKNTPSASRTVFLTPAVHLSHLGKLLKILVPDSLQWPGESESLEVE